MTDLSPAAQAVLDAYQLAPIEDELTIAVVLRTAADYLQQSFPWPHDDEGIGVEWAVNRLQDIADELEAFALNQYKIDDNEGAKTE